MSKAPQSVSQTFLDSVVQQWDNSNLSYADHGIKEKAHKDAKRLLTHFAVNYLKLTKEQFKVRSNLAGIAVSGEVTLHTNTFENGNLGMYIQIGQSCVGNKTMLVRSCKGQADYVGNLNNFGSVASLLGRKYNMIYFAVWCGQLTRDN